MSVMVFVVSTVMISELGGGVNWPSNSSGTIRKILVHSMPSITFRTWAAVPLPDENEAIRSVMVLVERRSI